MNSKVFAKDNQCVGLSMLVTDAQANFHSDVYKMPRDDLSSTSSFISKPRIIGMDGQAGPLQKNNSN